MQHRRSHLATSDSYRFGIGSSAAASVEQPQDGGGFPWTLVVSGRDEIILKVRSSGTLAPNPALRLNAESGRKLAGALLAFAGAIDGAPSD